VSSDDDTPMIDRELMIDHELKVHLPA